MKRTKKMIEASIMLAIDALSERIQKGFLEDENRMDAQTLKMLAEAYDIVHRGKKVDC